MYINDIFIENMGAIEKIQLSSEQLLTEDRRPKVLIFVGENGSGKTTLLSSIVDALYELSNNYFDDVLPQQGIGYKYFKMSGALNIRLGKEYAYSYIHFKNKDKKYEYLDKNGKLDFTLCKAKTNGLLSLRSDSKINSKISTTTKNDDEFGKDFEHNSYCYFPSDRYELPYWINREPLDTSEQFKDLLKYSGKLGRNILIRRCLEEVKQWILDVFIDSRTNLKFNSDGTATTTTNINVIHILQQSISNIEKIISKIIQKDICINLNFRGQSSSRIKLLDKSSGKEFIPTLDNLSAGQSTLLGIFITIIMYSDRSDISKSIHLNEIEGIVIIDEVDLHLHIELQKEVLPQLIKLFPKVQFIITTHSPFFLAGISKVFATTECLMINMPEGNIIERADDFKEFIKAYELFKEITNSHKEELEVLKRIIAQSSKPLVVTEGKTDWKHLKAALKKLAPHYPDLDIDFLEYEEELNMGSVALQKMADYLKVIPNQRKIIFIFDRDEDPYVKKYESEPFKFLENSIYALCIPSISDELNKISIEYYYSDADLKTKDQHGRRLFDGREFLPKSGNSKCGCFQLQDKNNAGKQIIIDKGVYDSKDLSWSKSLALSKSDFANNILKGEKNFNNVNFDNFRKILDVIKTISLI
ncbi:ATP-binding protein [Legionella busanensis]|nr:ATP-binding protein [Legionella busanensis]